MSNESERLLRLENRVNQVLSRQKPQVQAASPYNLRLAKVLATGPGSGDNTFTVEFVDGSYTKTVGTQALTTSLRGTNAMCHNIRNVNPPVGTVLAVFQWAGHWWTDFVSSSSPGGGDATPTQLTTTGVGQVETNGGYTSAVINTSSAPVIARITGTPSLRGVYMDFQLSGLPITAAEIRVITNEGAVANAGNTHEICGLLQDDRTAFTLGLASDVTSTVTMTVNDLGGGELEYIADVGTIAQEVVDDLALTGSDVIRFVMTPKFASSPDTGSYSTSGSELVTTSANLRMRQAP